MPVMVLFRHGDTISLAVIDRELNKRDSAKDVLRKVTLIKTSAWRIQRGRTLKFLMSFRFTAFTREFRFRNVRGTTPAWAKKLDSTDLNKRFYQDVSYWYLWAKSHPGVKLPRMLMPIRRTAIDLLHSTAYPPDFLLVSPGEGPDSSSILPMESDSSRASKNRNRRFGTYYQGDSPKLVLCDP